MLAKIAKCSGCASCCYGLCCSHFPSRVLPLHPCFCAAGETTSGKPVSVAVAQPHDHAQHAHVAAGKIVKSAPDAGAQLPDSQHTCGVCAACCHIVAIVQWPEVVAVGAAPQAELTEPFVRVAVTPSQVPEKPPRG